ncbi:MAG TPA: FkbM family methyltransferase [Bryobacteraceae bacterium]|nr:FkbM family methyltransferase [Bryobacteraceae bacterium]
MVQSPTENSGGQVVAADHYTVARRSYLTKAIGILARIRDYSRELGLFTGLRWYFAKIVTRLPLGISRRVNVKPPGLAHPVAVRMYPSSDDFVFDQLFVDHEYAPVCRRLKDVKVILDFGANTGLASAIFASRFPSARILAVEPDPGNYKVCLQNLAPYGNRIKVVLGAVWGRTARLALKRGNQCDGREWATQVSEAEQGSEPEVQAWDVPSLLDMISAGEADLIKMDIEGSEAEVFAENPGRWLTRVRNLCVELHDDRCREIFFRAVSGFDYETEEHGEYTFCFGLRPAMR